MNKTLSKTIMLRTNLRNKFLKNRSNENKTNYVNKGTNVSLLRKTKREYYSNLDENNFCDIFSKYQCAFRTGFSAQHCLVSILKKWKSAINIKESFGELLTDLPTAFNCLSHNLLIAKLNAYGFSMSTLRFAHSYLKNSV